MLPALEEEPVWREEPTPEVQDYEGFRLKILEMRRFCSKVIKDNWKHDTDDEFMQICKSLAKAPLLNSLKFIVSH